MNVQRESKPKQITYRWFWYLFLIGALLLIVRCGIVATQVQAIGMGQELMADDFGFTVVGMERLSQISQAGEVVKPSGQFAVINLQVANHAQRVDFHFDPSIVIMEDEIGQRYRLAQGPQNLIDEYATSINTLAAGENCRRKIVFDIPMDVGHPKLRIAFGGRIGEIADWLLYGNRWLEIPEREKPTE